MTQEKNSVENTEVSQTALPAADAVFTAVAEFTEAVSLIQAAVDTIDERTQTALERLADGLKSQRPISQVPSGSTKRRRL